MNNWEDTFTSWAKPPGKSEQERCENVEKEIKNAIKANDKLREKRILVFIQGSYRNNTNVRKDSDIDIGILCYDSFFYDLPEGYTSEHFNIIDASYHYTQFKNEVYEALISYFGRNSVKRGNKVFDIKENSYHVDADVAPFFEHRRYQQNGKYLSGVELYSDNGERVINWPEQHYSNGLNKNNDTNHRFKYTVRILKTLCNKMSENEVSQAKVIPGFLIECLVWNVPNNNLNNYTHTEDVRESIIYLCNKTKDYEDCKEWGEVSELIYLFRPLQKWTRQEANNFLRAAWNYIGFE
ncbi:MAG TPA: nucleotidyltransferase [Candidatus Atribacteria bacterium]|nr:nucleotidyltransferase [Candidatus Atribacteria bacterium]